ncbi:hypothetical protein OH77DRAFT_26036 [Trametes cingulata]|nr:hypothetical protein OH77DRAFT_26036 [Trametes cingulata]
MRVRKVRHCASRSSILQRSPRADQRQWHEHRRTRSVRQEVLLLAGCWVRTPKSTKPAAHYVCLSRNRNPRRSALAPLGRKSPQNQDEATASIRAARKKREQDAKRARRKGGKLCAESATPKKDKACYTVLETTCYSLTRRQFFYICKTAETLSPVPDARGLFASTTRSRPRLSPNAHSRGSLSHALLVISSKHASLASGNRLPSSPTCYLT